MFHLAITVPTGHHHAADLTVSLEVAGMCLIASWKTGDFRDCDFPIEIFQ